MKRWTLSAIVLLGAANAHAAGINLAWDDCLGGSASSAVRTFACDSNAGSTHTAFVSMIPPTEIWHWEAFEWEITVRSGEPVLPSWWQLQGAGQCRSGAITASASGAPAGCADVYAGLGTGGIQSYTVGFGGPNLARLVGRFAVPARGHADLETGVEYFVARLEITNAKTVGAGACAGCASPVCLEVTRVGWLALEQTTSITYPAVRAHLGWQPGGLESCDAGTPAARPTWGALKALYR